MARAPVIAASKEQITLNGVLVGEIGDDAGDDPKISDLHDQLVTLKNNFKLLHPSEHFHGTVIVAAEETIGFAELKRILYSCGLAGFPDVKLLVRQRR